MKAFESSRRSRGNFQATAELAAVEYPSSDGKPMAETERHAIATVDAWLALRRQFADREDVYVGMDMLLYYVEGDPRKSVVPDVFVVFGVPKLPPRDNWLAWREGKVPDFVLEVTSRHTRHCIGIWESRSIGNTIRPAITWSQGSRAPG